MKHVNIEEKTRAFNNARLQNQSKTFFYTELFDLLKSFGLSQSIIELANKHGFFDKEEINGRMIYSFQKTPLHKSSMEKFYEEKRKMVKKWQETQKAKKEAAADNGLTEEKCIAFLKERGFQISKCIGLDIERLAEENAELCQKYLKYQVL